MGERRYGIFKRNAQVTVRFSQGELQDLQNYAKHAARPLRSLIRKWVLEALDDRTSHEHEHS